jgi:hypothetical protein
MKNKEKRQNLPHNDFRQNRFYFLLQLKKFKF